MAQDSFLYIVFSLLPTYAWKAFVGFMIVLILDRVVNFIVSPLWIIPGSKTYNFFVGDFPAIRKEPFLAPAMRWWKDAGEDAKLLHYTTVLGKHSVIVLDKEIVKEVVTAKAGNKNARFNKKHDILKNILGNGLVSLEGAHWDRHRRIIQPSFSSSFLREELDKNVPGKAEQLVQYWKQAQGREIDVASHLSAITLDIIGDVAFSHSFHGMQQIAKWVEEESTSELGALNDDFISSMLDFTKPNLLTIFFSVMGMSSLDNHLNPKPRKLSRILNKAVDKVVQNAAKGDSKQKSLLQLLIKAKDADPKATGARTLNNLELRDETKTFLMAGHETTSTWCYWALFSLAKYPDVQEKVFADIEKHSKGSKSISWAMVEEMEYFNAFLQEVLRFYPPVGIFIRHNAGSEVLAGYTIPPETRIVIPVHLLHRHPLYWDDPETFSPERWFKMDEERIRFAFLPFSAGGRNCIGQRFATIEAKLILAPLIRSFRFQVAPSQRDVEFTLTSFITLKSKPTLKVVAQSRSNK